MKIGQTVYYQRQPHVIHAVAAGKLSIWDGRQMRTVRIGLVKQRKMQRRAA